MERVSKILIRLSALLLLWSPLLGAEVLLAPSSGRMAAEADQVDREYPVSRFGQGPSQPLVQRPGFNSQDSNAPQYFQYENNSEPNRAPARMTEQASHMNSQKSSSNSSTTRKSPFADLVPDRYRGVQEVSIIAGDLGFFPRTVFVTRDVPVRLYVTGASDNTLCIMIDSFNVRKQVRSKSIAEISFTPATPGQYRFYCPVNGMEGTLVVKELMSSVRSVRR